MVQALASNEHCAPEILDQLARHRRAHVRGEVACNENASALTLTHLLDDMSKEVRSYAMCTLARCASDADLQIRLLEEGDGSAFLELAQNPACCDAVLERLAGHADVIVRREVASNPRLGATLLDVMLRDADRSVREHAQRASSEREAVSA